MGIFEENKVKTFIFPKKEFFTEPKTKEKREKKEKRKKRKKRMGRFGHFLKTRDCAVKKPSFPKKEFFT